MKIFISWSKPTSRKFALLLRQWLPDVIQEISPWVSSEDIEKGQRWAVEVGEKLDILSEGLLCVTAENQHEPWLNFEAGALAKSLGGGKVRPVLLGLRPTDITGPLSQFQSTVATDREDMLKLLVSLNNNCGSPLEARRVESYFDREWDAYFGSVREIEASAAASAANSDSRSTEDMIREVLDLVRSMTRLEKRSLVQSDPSDAGGVPFADDNDGSQYERVVIRDRRKIPPKYDVK